MAKDNCSIAARNADHSCYVIDKFKALLDSLKGFGKIGDERNAQSDYLVDDAEKTEHEQLI